MMMVNAKTMAKIMDLSEQRINQLVSEGVIGKEPDGQYNFMQVIVDYYKNKSGLKQVLIMTKNMLCSKRLKEKLLKLSLQNLKVRFTGQRM